jgi:hypothetical protein
MFDDKSRYANTEQYIVTDRRGRHVNVVAVPESLQQALQGYHLLIQGQRADQLAAQYLDNPAGFWRIADINDSMLPEQLSEKPKIAIPQKTA